MYLSCLQAEMHPGESHPPEIAIIGAGTFVRTQYIPRLTEISNLVIVKSIWSRTQESATAAVEIARKFFPNVECKWGEEGLDSIMKDESVLGVAVVLAGQAQVDMSLKMLKAGKQVLQEKPAAALHFGLSELLDGLIFQQMIICVFTQQQYLKLVNSIRKQNRSGRIHVRGDFNVLGRLEAVICEELLIFRSAAASATRMTKKVTLLKLKGSYGDKSRWISLGIVHYIFLQASTVYNLSGCDQGGASIGIYFINRPEWIIVDHACSAYSYISVPVYDTLGPDAVKFIVNHADVQDIFCVPETLNSMLTFLSDIPSVRLIVVQLIEPLNSGTLKPLS